MLNIDDEIKTAFLSDSTPKELVIESGVPDEDRNFYSGSSNVTSDYSISASGFGHSMLLVDKYGQQTYNFSDCADMENMDNFDYVCAQFVCHITNYTGTMSTMRFGISFPVHGQGYNESAYYTANVTDLVNSNIQITLYLSTSGLDYDTVTLGFDKGTTSSDTFDGNISISNIMLSFSNNSSDFPKTYIPYEGGESEYFKITNDNLVSESFSLNESLCSEHNIKFGLCEAAYCQFTVADDERNYKDVVIKPQYKLSDTASINVFLPSVNFYKASYPPPGDLYNYLTYTNANPTLRFTIPSSTELLVMNENYYDEFNFVHVKMQIKFTNFSTDADIGYVLFYPNIIANKTDGTTYSEGRIWFDAIEFTKQENSWIAISDLLADWTDVEFYVPIQYEKYYDTRPELKDVRNYASYGVTTFKNFTNNSLVFRLYDSNGEAVTDSSKVVTLTRNMRHIQINLVKSKNDTIPEYNANDCIEYSGTSIASYLDTKNQAIPLGVFKVNSIKKHHVWDMIKQDITAYDDLTLLEQNAADWYTQYMFGINFDAYGSMSTPGFQFARQIFSTYFNYAKSVGLESDAYYTDSLIFNYDYYTSSLVAGALVSWPATVQDPYGAGDIRYIKYTVASANPDKLYRVTLTPTEHAMDNIPDAYYEKVDSLGRGITTGNVLVIENSTSETATGGYCVNSGDYFMVSDDCESFTIYVATQYKYDTSSIQMITYEFNLFEADSVPDLSNGHTRLVYYNYGTKEIFDCDSSITGRDVVHSLLEVNGCFYRLNRSTGRPEFIYCTKSGLYPRDDLYPADDLYPRSGANVTINMGQYQSFVQEDYFVQKYGKIQIRKNTTSNETKSIVGWEYTGDDSYENVYAIDDNIFYCNEKMEYDYDNMFEVSEMLANMWGRISNMDYTPCTLVCMGMPWIECGDVVGVLTKTGGAESFVFHRTLKGIQALTDTFESEGDEYTEAINDYGYKIIGGT